MRVRRGASGETKVEQQMTPMIDVVFQLLTFFIMSFKVVTSEGDFNIKMPLGAARPGSITENPPPPMKLRLQAGTGGELASMSLNQTTFGKNGWDALRSKIADIVRSDSGPGGVIENAEVELDCDYSLKYEYVIQAITAVSGYRDGNNNLVKLVDKVKFTPPKGGPGG